MEKSTTKKKPTTCFEKHGKKSVEKARRNYKKWRMEGYCFESLTQKTVNDGSSGENEDTKIQPQHNSVHKQQHKQHPMLKKLENIWTA